MDDMVKAAPQLSFMSQESYDTDQDAVSLASFSEAAMQKSLEASIPPQSPVSFSHAVIKKVKTGK